MRWKPYEPTFANCTDLRTWVSPMRSASEMVLEEATAEANRLEVVKKATDGRELGLAPIC